MFVTIKPRSAVSVLPRCSAVRGTESRDYFQGVGMWYGTVTITASIWRICAC